MINLKNKNDVTEEEQRWGAKTVEGSGHIESVRYYDYYYIGIIVTWSLSYYLIFIIVIRNIIEITSKCINMVVSNITNFLDINNIYKFNFFISQN